MRRALGAGWLLLISQLAFGHTADAQLAPGDSAARLVSRADSAFALSSPA